MLRAIKDKTLDAVVAEWDVLAETRHHQISSGIDLSYNYVISPSVLHLVKSLSPASVLDAGCGTGALTTQIAALSVNVVGLDPSGRSLEIARRHQGSGVRFIQETMENFAAHCSEAFDIIVANMVLMDVLTLESFLKACAKLVNENGAFIFSITHPCFWPTYRGYSELSWFKYERDIIIEAPFRISADPNNALVSTHIHRPLSAYLRGLEHAGFVVALLLEPLPTPDVEKQYPAPWRFPRYLVGLCFKRET